MYINVVEGDDLYKAFQKGDELGWFDDEPKELDNPFNADSFLELDYATITYECDIQYRVQLTKGEPHLISFDNFGSAGLRMMCNPNNTFILESGYFPAQLSVGERTVKFQRISGYINVVGLNKDINFPLFRMDDAEKLYNFSLACESSD